MTSAVAAVQAQAAAAAAAAAAVATVAAQEPVAMTTTPAISVSPPTTAAVVVNADGLPLNVSNSTPPPLVSVAMVQPPTSLLPPPHTGSAIPMLQTLAQQQQQLLQQQQQQQQQPNSLLTLTPNASLGLMPPQQPFTTYPPQPPPTTNYWLGSAPQTPNSIAGTMTNLTTGVTGMLNSPDIPGPFNPVVPSTLSVPTPPRTATYDPSGMYSTFTNDRPMTPLGGEHIDWQSEAHQRQQQQHQNAFASSFLRGVDTASSAASVAGGVNINRSSHSIVEDWTGSNGLNHTNSSNSSASRSRSSHRSRLADTNDLGRAIIEKHSELNSVSTFRRQLDRREVGARRLKYYFSTLSELLTAEQFTQFTSELHVQIPLSCRSPYSLVEAAAALAAQQKKKEAEEEMLKRNGAQPHMPILLNENGNGNNSAAPVSPNNPTNLSVCPSLQIFYIDYSWRSSPTTCLSDTESTGLAGPIAVMRLERLSPFLEDPHVFYQRKLAARKSGPPTHTLSPQSTSTSILDSKRRSRRDRKRHRRRRVGKSDTISVQSSLSPSTGPSNVTSPNLASLTGTATNLDARASTHRRSSSKCSHRRQRRKKLHNDGSGLTIAPDSTSNTENSNTPNNASVNDDTLTAADKTEPDIDSDQSIAESVSDYSSDYASSDPGEVDTSTIETHVEGCSGPLSFPPLSKYHVPSCVHFDHLLVSQEAVANGNLDLPAPGMPIPAAATPCSCPPLQQVSMCLQVNAEWERLFGVTQSELRVFAMKEGHKALNK